MTDLISRLEALEGPSRGVDAEIAVQTRWMLLGMEKPDIQFAMPTAEDNCEPGTFWQINFGKSLHTAPEFTAFQQAALALLEDGLFRLFMEHIEIKDRNDNYAIAICIAALRARDKS